jgi:AhpD family alkylhydroperoxidase
MCRPALSDPSTGNTAFGVSWADDNVKRLESTMQPRIENPALTVPGALAAFQKLGAAVKRSGVPETTLQLVDLRASQINGCSVCVDMHSRELKAAGEPDERILMVAAWRESPYFSDAERAALALTEAATRLADRPDAVNDEVWEQAARYYDERGLAALVVKIAVINAFNRINAATGQITGPWVAQYIQPAQPAVQAA